MNDQEMLDKLKESAGDIRIPQALEPEQIKKQLQGRRRIKKKWYRLAATAACLCLLAGSISYQSYVSNSHNQYDMQNRGPFKNGQASRTVSDDNRQASDWEDTDGNSTDTVKENITDTDGEKPLKKLGKMYTLASDYGEVYDVLKKTKAVYSVEKDWDLTDGAVSREEEKSAGAFVQDDAGQAQAEDYSVTNLQTDGVNESDIVKTDGSYIYVVQEEQVKILDVNNQIPELIASIRPELETELVQICEMFVSDQILTLIIQTEKTSMEKGDGSKNKNGEKDSGSEEITEENNEAKKMQAVDDVYCIDTTVETGILTYDISSPEKPVFQKLVSQDGWYQTSRKIDNYLYLFTTQSLRTELSRKYAVTQGMEREWLPHVNGQTIRADCIYLPSQGNQGMILSSIDLADDSRVVDTKLLVDQFVELYVSRNSVYMYRTDYTDKGDRTRIARFVLNSNGMIQAKAAASVKGSIQDTFAICEADGYLRVLTSVINSEPRENHVYVLDEDMKITGRITGLAKGESIYSARFTGKTGYFVTYRNTDPLFTVDFSNPEKPEVKGKLKVTGFSEYLHFWNNSLLLGVGYETNPQDGSQTGVKLSMFDISNPLKVREKARIVLEDADESAGMYQYKCILVDKKKNIIALTTENYDENDQLDYRVFSYKNGRFVSRLKRTLSRKYSYRNNGYTWRSLYVGNILYLVNARKTIAFDINNGYKEIGKVKY